MELDRFDPGLPITAARTPPASWYTSDEIHALELRTAFRKSWQPVARTDQLVKTGDFVADVFAGEPWVVVQGEHGAPRGFFNVCRHHASCIVEGEGRIESFVCPYHGWTYALDGKLRKAPRLGALEGFDRTQFGLVPIATEVWDPLVFVRIGESGPRLDEVLRPLDGRIDRTGLRFVARRTYDIDCNWKVFVDNYLDGGYHVEHMHPGLAGQLDLDSYETAVDGFVSLQTCSAGGGGDPTGKDFGDRLGQGSVYAFVYPNLMINRYGPILDTNWVIPLGPHRMRTIFDYWFDESVASDATFVGRSLAASHQVQLEDIVVCERVQRGLRSRAYGTGVYAPQLEHAAYHFHRQLAADLQGSAPP